MDPLSSMSAFIISTSSGFEGEARREIIRILNPVTVSKLFFKGNLYVESNQNEEEYQPQRIVLTSFMMRSLLWVNLEAETLTV